MTRHFLRDDDLAPDELVTVLDLADELKAARRERRYERRPLAGPQAVALIFDKQTLRTQLSFSVGIAELGGQPVVLDAGLAGIGVRESVADTARVLSRQVVAVVWRTYEQSHLEQLAAAGSVPVVNALTDAFHPCQVLADLQTVRERTGGLAGRTLAYLGDAANNMAHSYLLGGAGAGLHVRVAGPHGYHPDPTVVHRSREIAAGTGGSVLVTDRPEAALDGADVVATDTWVSMGQHDEHGARERALRPFAVTAGALERAAPDVTVLHCLPAYRGAEIAADVLDGPHSAVWDQAENRLHAQKALLTFLLERS